MTGQNILLCRGSSDSFSGGLHNKFRELGVELLHFPMKHSAFISYISLFCLFLKKKRFDSIIDFSGCLLARRYFISYLAGVDVELRPTESRDTNLIRP